MIEDVEPASRLEQGEEGHDCSTGDHHLDEELRDLERPDDAHDQVDHEPVAQEEAQSFRHLGVDTERRDAGPVRDN